jgi:succinoglycan biosynthesis protein ExoO
MSPVVSVIIPVYNTEDYIERAVRSVLEQSFQDLEVVVVDDASTDRSFEVVNAIKDSRVKLFKNEQNSGAGATRNRAIQESTGEWIAVLDSDDWYAPQRLESLLNFAKAKDADMVADDLYIVEDDDPDPRTTLFQWSKKAPESPVKITVTDFVLSDIEGRRGLSLGFSKPLFKRDFLMQNNIHYKPEIIVSQDFWIDMDCLISGAQFWILPQPYYYYRSRIGSLTSSTKATLRLNQECDAIKNFLATHKSYLSARPDLEKALKLKLKETAKYRDYYRVVELIRGKRFASACQELFKSIGFFEVLLVRIPGIIQRRVVTALNLENVYLKFN